MSNNQSIDFNDPFFTFFNEPLIAIQRDEELPLSPQILQMSTNHSSSMNSDLICGVCSAPAHGYNFDQITCESCKAFFRRNALKNTSQWICRYAGSCQISVATRRQCAFCRLKKCLDIGMRKDWIRTDQERQFRRLQQLLKEQKRLQKATK